MACLIPGFSGYRKDDPVGAFFKYVAENQLRLIDMFRMLDKDQSWTVSLKELKKWLRTLRVPLTDGQINKMIDAMDTDGDGELHWREMVKGRYRIFILRYLTSILQFKRS